VRLGDVVSASRAVAATSGRLDKTRQLAALLSRTPSELVPVVVGFLTGEPRQGKVNVGMSLLSSLRDVPPADEQTLDVADVDRAFDRLAATSGAGSARVRGELLRDLFERATGSEQEFLSRLLFGEIRQGALEGVVADAVARASGLPAAKIRRAAMLAGSLAAVAQAALGRGETALEQFILQPFQPVQPMLADSAADVAAALGDLGQASFEYKLDGARVQAHKAGDEVRVYSRNLRDVTIAVPEVVDVVRAMPAKSILLDGEAIVLRPDGRPQPFQITMRRFGRKLDVDDLKASLPITPFFFDALYVDGSPLVDEPLTRRLAVLNDFVPPAHLVPRIVTANADEAAAFATGAMNAGHEGVMAKALEAGYAAGRRGSAWLKVKQARTLDLVILAAEWGSGRRKGTLSNLHLGARDGPHGGFVMLGKTFKGLTDAMLAWQTKRFLELEVARDHYTVYVKPEVVAEIAFNEIQASPQYPGGLALRFARVKRYRDDKSAAEADTIATVRQMYQQMTGG
jgi:DNA ligase-1